ncbi:hypothetical protein ACFQS1_22400 [Paractinoplanes rhizophilus]|uniref:Uncharacterized protein n=1 Tax=Paractinoplanes rhizophilus TaxID=1416877 RepID=A0ABW2HX99_9ACTN|nr:hypothetical protein [Actinoplanes sp.]
MTTQDMQPSTDEDLDRAVERLQYALGCEPEFARAILTRDPEGLKQIREFVRRDEVENADFYRALGNR